MKIAFFRLHRVNSRLNDAELEKLKDLMALYGKTTFSETIRFMIDLNHNNNHNGQLLQLNNIEKEIIKNE